MINWNAIATPPRPVPLFMEKRIEAVHSLLHKGEFDFLAWALDKMDKSYFGHQPAEPNARSKQSDLFGGTK